jgi:hypothetical protein
VLDALNRGAAHTIMSRAEQPVTTGCAQLMANAAVLLLVDLDAAGNHRWID